MTQKYRPFRNDPTRELTVTWYPALKEAKTLPYSSVIDVPDWYDRNSGIFFEDGDFAQQQPKRFNNAKPKPGALGITPCGTQIDFEQGGLALPDDPPVIYNSNGLPKCCGAPLVLGPVGAGLPDSKVQSLPVLPGEAKGAGTPASDVTHYPPGASPGTDCTTATLSPVGAQQCSTITNGGELWYSWHVPTAGPLTIHLTGITDLDVDFGAFGGICPGGLTPFPLFHIGGTFTWGGIAMGAFTLYLKITGIGTGGAFCVTLTQP